MPILYVGFALLATLLVVAIGGALASPRNMSDQMVPTQIAALTTNVPTTTPRPTQPIATGTPMPTATSTPEPTQTVTPPPTPTVASPTPTSTATPSYTPTITLTPSSTPIPSRTPIPTRTPKPTTPPSTPTPAEPIVNYSEPVLKIWAGVKVYYGKGIQKTYGFTILGGSEDCPSMPSKRGLKVLYPDGTEEWKDRNNILESGIFFVRDDDPATKARDWYEFDNCP